MLEDSEAVLLALQVATDVLAAVGPGLHAPLAVPQVMNEATFVLVLVLESQLALTLLFELVVNATYVHLAIVVDDPAVALGLAEYELAFVEDPAVEEHPAGSMGAVALHLALVVAVLVLVLDGAGEFLDGEISLDSVLGQIEGTTGPPQGDLHLLVHPRNWKLFYSVE